MVCFLGYHLNLMPQQSFVISGYLMSVSKEQIKVFEGLPQEEGLHHVLWPRVLGVKHVADGSVARANLRVILYSL